MKIGVVGLGFVGLVTAAVLSSDGFEVIGIDVDPEKIRKLKEGKVPIYEPELEKYIRRGNPEFSLDYTLLRSADLTFVSVPTPTVDRNIDLSFIFDAVGKISGITGSDIVIKSTVVPGTAKKIMDRIPNNVISNPEFLREGAAIHDTLHPDRVIIGGNNAELVERVWSFTGAPAIKTTNENAELIKYASNAFLATKISFINEIANLCEQIPETDVDTVATGMGLDRRIGSTFLKAGIGYGGSCFPKDTQALMSFADSFGQEMKIVRSATEVNESRIQRFLDRMGAFFENLSDLKVLQLGLSFKDNTNDSRESPALNLYYKLKDRVKQLTVYDPVSKVEGVDYCMDLEVGLKDKDAIVIATEWPEFKILEKMDVKIPIFDGRRILDPAKFKKYIGVGLYEQG